MKNWLLAIVTTLFTFNTIAADAERIVSIGGDVTEILVALGGEKQLIARDSTSTSPSQVTKLPNVGYMRALNAEGILAMRPTLVLSSKLASPSHVLQQVERNNVKVVYVTDDTSLEAIDEKIETIGNTIGQTQNADVLRERINKELTTLPKTKINKKVLFIMNHGGSAPMIAGQKTAADSMIRTVGAQNAMQGFNHYRLLSQEGVIASQPNLIVLTTEGLKTFGGLEKIWTLPGISLTPAGKHKALIVVDDMGFLGFGLQTPKVLQQLRNALEKSP